MREYVGGGALGQLAFLEDEERRLERQASRAAARRERERLLAVRESLDAHRAAVDRVMVDVLEALGFHRRKGEWRRRRTK